MLYRTIFFPVLALFLILMGCSSSQTQTPITSDNLPNTISDIESGNWEMWSYGTFVIDESTLAVKVFDYRETQGHINITRMIPSPSLRVNSYNPSTKIVNVDVTLRNPYQIQGYDVRLIIMSDSYGHDLINADGYTSLFDQPGGNEINPFKTYAKEIYNRAFGPNSQFTENFQIYKLNLSEPVTFVVEASFPTNCPEPYDIQTISQQTLYDIPGSVARLQMEVLDWQHDVDSVILEAPAIINEPQTSMIYLNEFIWILDLVNNASAPAGDYQCLIRATSTGSGELAIYDYLTLTVTPYGTPITLDSPSDREQWLYTNTEDILWRAVVAIPNIKIELSKDSGATYDYVIAESTPNDGKFEWEIPISAVGENNKIRISDVSDDKVFDESDREFSIICPIPSIPENVTATQGSSQEWIKLQWDQSSYVSYYNIYRDNELIEPNYTETTWYDYSASAGTHYNYEIEAVNDCGASERSIPAEGWLDDPITDWTIMVYLHESNLLLYALQDINEMETAGSVPGDLNILVLWDVEGSPNDVLLYIEKDSSVNSSIVSTVLDEGGEIIPTGGLVMGDQITLERFLRWSMREYPAQNYGLVLWDHGDGPFSIIQDDGFIRSCCNGLQIWEIRDACQTVLNEHPETDRFEFIGFDACLMGWIEITYCLRNVTRVTIGSEMLEPGAGWKYSTPLVQLRDNIETTTTEQLCTSIVQNYLLTGSDNTLAAASTDALVSDVIPLLNSFASQMTSNMSSWKTQIASKRTACGKWGAYCNESHVRDFGLFASLIAESTLPSSIRDTASQLDNAIESAMIYHGHSGSGSDACPYLESGWQIWFPSDYANSSNSTKRSDYQKLGFTDTTWEEFLAAYD